MPELITTFVVAVTLLLLLFAGAAMASDDTGAYPQCKADGCDRQVEYPPETNGRCPDHYQEEPA